MAETTTVPVDLNAVRSPPASHVVIPVAAVATLSVIARIYSRRLKKIELAAADYFIICGLVMIWGCVGVAIESTLTTTTPNFGNRSSRLIMIRC